MVIIVIALLAGGLFLLQKMLYRRFWLKGLSVSLAFDKELAEAGGQAKLYEVVENEKWLPLPSLKVKFQCSRYLQFTDVANGAVTDRYYRNDLFSVMPYKRITRTLPMECPKRGCYRIYGIDLVGADLFFSEEMHYGTGSEALLYVIPAPLSKGLLQEAMQRINGEIAVKRYELEDPFTYRGIREYQPQDEMKQVNWKATAKTGELKVNMRESTAMKAVRIFLNLEDRSILRREELLEGSISICAATAGELVNQGIKTAVFGNALDCFSGQVLEMEGGSHQGWMDQLYRALARLDLEKAPADFGECFQERLLGEEDMYTVFISPERHQEFQKLLLNYGEKGDFTWICPVKEMETETILPALLKHTVLVKIGD